MPRFFCDAIAGGKAVITGEDAAHIARSLRMQPGERLTLSDGQGTDFDCVLDLVTPQEVFSRRAGELSLPHRAQCLCTALHGDAQG